MHPFLGILFFLFIGGNTGTQVSTHSRSYSNFRETCMPYDTNPRIGAKVIRKCPSNFIGPALLKSKCELEKDISDPMLAAPATDTQEQVTFKNRYCAECHGAPPADLESWMIYLYCGNLQPPAINESYALKNLQYRGDLRKWGVKINGRFHSCQIGFDKPSSLNSKVRNCHISGTPCMQRRVEKACTLCRLHEAKGLRLMPSPCEVCHGSFKLCDEERSRFKRVPISLAMLMDYDWRDGDIVGKVHVQRCSSGEIFDPFAIICRKIECVLPGFIMVDGKCIRPTKAG